MTDSDNRRTKRAELNMLLQSKLFDVLTEEQMMRIISTQKIERTA